jgi:hypothetical protein
MVGSVADMLQAKGQRLQEIRFCLSVRVAAATMAISEIGRSTSS